MSRERANIVICGAGIAGVAAAYFLSARQGIGDVLLVDEGAPLSLTSDKSTECYRNWWPDAGSEMTAFMNRSIDLLEHLTTRSGDRFLLTQRGYLFATARQRCIAQLERSALECAALGAGELRVHGSGGARAAYESAPPGAGRADLNGADLITDVDLIERHFAYLSHDTVAVLHARRCGWLSAQQLGAYLLEQARVRGVTFRSAKVERVEVDSGRVSAVELLGRDGHSAVVETPCFVNAAGPKAGEVARYLDVELPIVFERHVKLAFNDSTGAVPRDAPLLVWMDPVTLPWLDDEREALASDPDGRLLLEEFPAGVHGRPVGAGTSVLLYWTYDNTLVQPTFPIISDPHYPEIVVRGMSVMVPALTQYFQRLPKVVVDGGYYTKTSDNRPLIGPLPVEGAYITGAFSGYGIMAACAAGELLAQHVTGDVLADYATAFSLARFSDPSYMASMREKRNAGQL